MSLSNLNIDKSWTLFLDRDGVINERIPGDYVKEPYQFHFLPGVLDAVQGLTVLFGRIIVVTNQQGIGKGKMTVDDLELVHKLMTEEISGHGGKLDAIFFCPDLAQDNPECRKPNPGMGLRAKKIFPDIDFTKAIMVGDMPSDIGFAKNLGMKSVWCHPNAEKKRSKMPDADYFVRNLYAFYLQLKNEN